MHTIPIAFFSLFSDVLYNPSLLSIFNSPELAPSQHGHNVGQNPARVETRLLLKNGCEPISGHGISGGTLTLAQLMHHPLHHFVRVPKIGKVPVLHYGFHHEGRLLLPAPAEAHVSSVRIRELNVTPHQDGQAFVRTSSGWGRAGGSQKMKDDNLCKAEDKSRHKVGAALDRCMLVFMATIVGVLQNTVEMNMAVGLDCITCN